MIMVSRVQSMSEDIFPVFSVMLTILETMLSWQCFAKAGSKVFSVSESSWTVKIHCETLHFCYYMKIDLTWARSPWSSSFWPVIPNGCTWGLNHLELLNWFKTAQRLSLCRSKCEAQNLMRKLGQRYCESQDSTVLHQDMTETKITNWGKAPWLL